MDANSTESDGFELVCYCGNDTFLNYTYDNIYYGKVCQKCWKEWLVPDVVDGNFEQHRPPSRRLFSRQISLPEFKRAFAVTPSRKEVKREDLSSLSPGLHVMWRRPYVLWHHAIVVQAADEGSEIFKVLHWSQDKKSIRIHEKEVTYSKELGKMYRATYDENVIRKNPPGLVLARAYALEGSKDYQFFSKNCENYAMFCKTGVNFNHQFPWLMLKLDETATGALAQLLKASRLLPVVSTILLAEGVEDNWDPKQELIGAGTVLLLELISLVTDLGNMYFEYKYPTSCCKLEKKDYKQSNITRTCEFLFGATGMIGGAISCEKLTTYVGAKICPGLGTLLGFGLGTFVFGVIGGFLFGVFAKAIGNAVGIFIGRRCLCCAEPVSVDETRRDSTVPMILEADSSDSDAEDTPQRRKMRKVYRPSSWEAQLGFALIIFCCVLLYAFTKQYMDTYRDFVGNIKATCIPVDYFYKNVSKTYPCVAIQVNVVDDQFLHNQTDLNNSIVKEEIVTQLFENEKTLGKGNCSYDPWCPKNDTKTENKVKKYVQQFFPDHGDPINVTCYHQANNQSLVIRNPATTVFFVITFSLPSLVLLCGILLIAHAMVRLRTQDENCFATLIVVLGLRSYFDLLERCRCCCGSS